MDDIEKSRAEYVAKLEAQLKHATQQLNAYKADAVKWTPVAKAEITNNTLSVAVSFAGRKSQVNIDYTKINIEDTTTLVTEIIDAFVKSSIADRFKEVIKPEVERVLASANKIQSAGNW